MYRWILAGLLATAALVAGQAANLQPVPGQEKQPNRMLPGVEPDGSVRLHNTWTLKPAGKQLELGDFPVNIAVHPSGDWLAVLHCGYGAHEIIVVSVKADKQSIASRAPIKQGFYGLCFSPDGKKLYASGGENDLVHAFDFKEGLLSGAQNLTLANGSFAGGLALDGEGKQLAVAGTWGHVVKLLRTDDAAAKPVSLKMDAKSYPYACLFDPARKRLYVSLWAKAKIAVLELNPPKIVANYSTEQHPTEMLLSADGKQLYAACANSTKVSVLNADDGKGIQVINTALFANAPPGNSPCSLSTTPDGQLLFVANADNNNVAVFNTTDAKEAKPMGFIPVGYYPTSVRYSARDKNIYVANGRGSTPKANPKGPNPVAPKKQSTQEYIAGLYRGTLTTVAVPTEEQMIAFSKDAYACVPLRADLGVRGIAPKDNAIPAKLGEASPIKHCIYIIRENRTYDQVLGDMKEGNGDASLCIFGEKVTPNAHKLARDYVLLDNFYVEAEVSADGHEWSMGAFCTDFVKKAWPLNYRGSKKVKYPAEGNNDEVARPAGGYLWDRCAEAGLSYRSYGEWVDNWSDNGTEKKPAKARVKALEGHIDPWYKGFDMEYSDITRAERFIEELKGFEKTGDLPRLTIVRLPNDHTSGTRVGKLTPTAFVAENDLALGMVIEAISKSKFWKETAIFVLEDDAQNGSDHVDAHRTVALVVSPYTKRGIVDSTMYATSSLLRTMELILGLQPMSQYDAAATPMYNSFQAKADLRPFDHVSPGVDIKATNGKGAYGAELSEKMDFTREDAADDLLLNDIIWRSVRGPESPMPPPVRAAFVFPK
jgi:DNA-binding beta-propeller fold protein YncE